MVDDVYFLWYRHVETSFSFQISEMGSLDFALKYDILTPKKKIIKNYWFCKTKNHKICDESVIITVRRVRIRFDGNKNKMSRIVFFSSVSSR